MSNEIIDVGEVPGMSLTATWGPGVVVLEMVHGGSGSRVSFTVEQALVLAGQLAECGYLARWMEKALPEGSGVKQ